MEGIPQEPEKHLPHDLDIWSLEEIALRALVDKLYGDSDSAALLIINRNMVVDDGEA